MTPEQHDELRRFYAYRQVRNVRDRLHNQLRRAHHDLDGAKYKYNVWRSFENQRRVELAYARVMRIRSQLKELDTIGRLPTND